MAAKVRAATALQFLVLRSTRAEKVLAFYGALGLEFTAEKHGNGPSHYACELGGLVLEIYPRRPGEMDAMQDGVILGLRVASVEDSLAELAAGFSNSPLVGPPGAGRLLTANLRDPDGRTVILTAG